MIPQLNIGLPDSYQVNVLTTEGRGFTPEELAQQCADKIISISDEAHPAIQAQAHAFKAVSYTHLTLPTKRIV